MKNIIEDVKLSIQLEEKGYDFYIKTAEKTGNPLAGSTLQSLAERELIHIEKIKEFYKDLTGEKILRSDWLKNVGVAPSKKSLIKPIIEKLKNNLEKKFETDKNINEAYKIAEGLETDSYKLYTKIANSTDDETAKKFYTALAQEEKEHYAILDETLEYLNNPGDWFKAKERWIVEG